MTDKPKLEPEPKANLKPKADVKIEFYHEDRIVVLETKEMDNRGRITHSQYKMNLSSLKLHAPILVNFFIEELNLNGIKGTEMDPIILPFLTQEFSNFLHWIYDREWCPFQLTEESLVDLLEVAFTLKAEDGISYAVHGLESLGTPPARMLELVGDFHHIPDVHRWLGPAVKALIQRPLGEITQDEERQILVAYPTIARTREAICTLLMEISQATFPLFLVDKEQGLPSSEACSEHAACIESWHSVWKEKITSCLLDFKKPLTYKELLDILQSTNFPLGSNLPEELKLLLGSLQIQLEGNFSPNPSFPTPSPSPERPSKAARVTKYLSIRTRPKPPWLASKSRMTCEAGIQVDLDLAAQVRLMFFLGFTISHSTMTATLAIG
ncbi:hypothetical protein F5879DRAFT_995284 [Lentinula edodes]|nr:hypothetical protein F5879DRAFT_995284 [Lentinula edodes]